MSSIKKRVLWHINRSPLKHVVKLAKSSFDGRDIRRRRELSYQLAGMENITAYAEALKRDGYVVLDTLIPLAARQDLLDATDLLARSNGQSRKAFDSGKSSLWSHLVEKAMSDGQLSADHAITRFALLPEVTGLVSKAFGMVPRLDYVTVTHSVPVDGELAYSQLWHRDHDDVRVLKMFVYLTDVADENDGPFSFIPGSHSDLENFSMRSHRRDDELPAKLGYPQSVKAIMGPKLTCFMVETTRCLHMGSRVAPGHSRLMYTATYFAPPRVFPEPTQGFFRVDIPLGEIEKAMLVA
jgi:hypothetical protein